MNRIQGQQTLNEETGVHEWFEFIAGVGTAAITAALLGRLRMSIEDAVGYFNQLADQVYNNKNMTGAKVRSAERKTTKLV
ncbi:calcium-independent phospholipase A2-gamma [Ceratobasidium sp. AG-Ba]|nr:calcium-independent phospholipase A2-gamma [Ceratobasidium sp. AG-Ba]